MRKSSVKNILLNDGTSKRLPHDECEELLATKKAKRFISNTVHRALKLGIEVKDHGTRDQGGKLKSLVQAAQKTVTTSERKVEAKRLKKAAEAAEAAEE